MHGLQTHNLSSSHQAQGVQVKMTFKTVGSVFKTPKYCNCPPSPKRALPDSNPARLQLIRRFEKKWVNGMTLKYHFLKSREFAGPASYEVRLRF